MTDSKLLAPLRGVAAMPPQLLSAYGMPARCYKILPMFERSQISSFWWAQADMSTGHRLVTPASLRV